MCVNVDPQVDRRPQSRISQDKDGMSEGDISELKGGESVCAPTVVLNLAIAFFTKKPAAAVFRCFSIVELARSGHLGLN